MRKIYASPCYVRIPLEGCIMSSPLGKPQGAVAVAQHDHRGKDYMRKNSCRRNTACITYRDCVKANNGGLTLLIKSCNRDLAFGSFYLRCQKKTNQVNVILGGLGQ